jgi:histidinol-phosphate/aromatic aminotransferase/cobyric acid decarboxylase-like protein
MNAEQIKIKIQALKLMSGTHSPSINTLLSEIPELKIKIDACFLSNPYATDLFMDYFFKISSSNKLRLILEFYPPQNVDVAKRVGKILNVDPSNLFIGNGAIEVIQACMHRFAGKSLALPIPTFSSYYEFLLSETRINYYQLDESNNFKLDLYQFTKFIEESKSDSAVIINPNNPVGDYLDSHEIIQFLENNSNLDLIVIDESFMHFAYEDETLSLIDNAKLIKRFPNLVLVKSMSKDFGIAGVRAGYGVMSQHRVSELLNNGYLWNISGIADYFFELYSDKEFLEKYELVRRRYINETQSFLKLFREVDKIQVFPSKANFVLVKLPNGVSSFDFCIDMLLEHGIYLRDCSDKIGLLGSFVRVASRTFDENITMINAFKSYFGKV